MSILALTSNTLTSPAAAGQIEYTSPIFAATPIGTQRGIVPTQQYYRLDSAYVGSNVATAQSLFGVGVTLSSSTVYEFEIVFVLSKTAGATGHSLATGFGGTATVNNIFYTAYGIVNGTLSTTPVIAANASILAVATASSTVITPAVGGATLFIQFIIKGTVSINAGGTFIPQYTLSAAPGGAYSTVAGSYIRINPLSASGAATNVGTWA
jgi:hypothetical protein